MHPTSVLFQYLTVLLICNVALVKSITSIDFNPNSVSVQMDDSITVEYLVTEIDNDCVLYSEDSYIAYLEDEDIVLSLPNQNGSFVIKGHFLGETTISCKDPTTDIRAAENQVNVKCLREQRAVDSVFTAFTATLVAIIYINFGCAVQWGELRTILKKPIGPILGFSGQFILMPLLTYGMGLVIFPNDPAMRLGMFFSGVSPGGGASNIWTAILDGNIDLSIIMTAVSTLAAFGMIPLWMFTLGKTIFDDANLAVPYGQITTYVLGLIIPLAIGYLIQRYLKKIAAFFTRILKGFSTLLIMFIIIFAIVTNLYLFELMSWRIIVAGMVVPWMGYISGYIIAKILRQPNADALAIAMEIGVQNTGISIFLLRFSLEPLYADLTTVIPVSIAIMTPLPPACMICYKKIKQRFWPKDKLEINEECKETKDQPIIIDYGNNKKEAAEQ